MTEANKVTLGVLDSSPDSGCCRKVVSLIVVTNLQLSRLSEHLEVCYQSGLIDTLR